MKEPLKFLFKFPCRGREKSLFESLNSLNNNIRDRDNYHISLTLDTDDPVLNNEQVISALSLYPNISIEWGLSGSKIAAINRSMSDYDWDVVICWSNDMVCTFFGFDDIIRGEAKDALQEHDYDLLLHLPEEDTKDILNTLYIATRKYYERFGYIYHPSYLSLFCDNETMAVSKMLGRYHFLNTYGLYVHKNPAYHVHGLERDELFDYQQSLWGVDEKNYNERVAIKFGLKDEEIVNRKIIAGGRVHNF